MRPAFTIPRTFLIFCCVGAFNTLVNYGAFLFFLKLVAWPYVLSGALGFLAGALTGFFLNRAVTFKSQIAIGRGLLFYLGIQAFCLGVHSSIQYVSVHSFGLAQGLSQLPGIVVTTFLNYALSKKLVFTAVKKR